jgi:hypothetical protein
MNESQGLRVAVTLIALALAALHGWIPDFTIDAITIVLLVIAAVPWARPLIKSIELLGVKLELQEIKGELADAKGAAQSAERKADYLLAAPPAAPASPTSSPDTRKSASFDASFAKLMEDYEEIRDNQNAGAARTRAMTSVVQLMIQLAPSVRSFNLEDALTSDRHGRRLAAYASLYAQPDFRWLEPLVTSVTQQEDKPFGQYWGLQAIERVLASRANAQVPGRILTRLQLYSAAVPRDSDRGYEVRKILRDLEPKPAND